MSGKSHKDRIKNPSRRSFLDLTELSFPIRQLILNQTHFTCCQTPIGTTYHLASLVLASDTDYRSCYCGMHQFPSDYSVYRCSIMRGRDLPESVSDLQAPG